LSEQYVADVLEVCLAVVEESSDASTAIQRIWRGFKARQAYLNRPRKRPFQRPVPKVTKKVSQRLMFAFGALFIRSKPT